MDHQQSIPTETVDQLLSLLANSRRREAIIYMSTESADVFSVEDIASELSTQSSVEADRITIESYHWILPQLADASVVTYDRKTGAVQYRGRSELESLVDSLQAEIE